MTTPAPRRRRQPQHRLLCSADTVRLVDEAVPGQVAATVVEVGKSVTKIQVTDALIRVALRHTDEVTAELIREHGRTPPTGEGENE